MPTTDMASDEEVEFYKAVLDGDLVSIKKAIDGGADPAATHFCIQTDEMCLCSLAFENLGLEFVEDLTQFDCTFGQGERGEPDGCDGPPAGGSSSVPSDPCQPKTRLYQPPLVQWLQVGQCGHVNARTQGEGGPLEDFDQEEDMNSDNDLDSDIDLEIYGVRISPQRAQGDEELEYEETRALLEHSRRMKQYEVPTPPDALPAAPDHHTPPSTRDHGKDVTDSMNNLLLNDASDDVNEEADDDNEDKPLSDPITKATDAVSRHSTGLDILDQTRSMSEHLCSDTTSNLNDILSTQAEADDDLVLRTPLNPCRFPYLRELESVGSEDGVGSDFFLTEIKQASVTPLHIAAAKGHSDVLEYLVTELECNVNISTLGSEDTPLHIAARWGKTDTVRLLLRLRADPHRLNAMGYSALHLAIESNDQECINAMLDSLTDLPSLDLQTKQILIVHSLATDTVSLATSLLQKLQIDINEPFFDCGSTVLHKAAAVGSCDCIKYFLGNCADPNATNQEGESPLHVAAANGHTQCIQDLLAAGARPVPSPNWMIGDNQTPTMLAAYNNYSDVLKVLLPHDDVNCCSEYGDTALHYAAYRGCVEAVHDLLEAGAEVNKRNCYGATPLWNGVCHVDVLKLLIQAGADVNGQSSGHNLDHIDGVVYDSPRSPLEVAVEEGFFDSAEVLLRAGCKVPVRIQRLLGQAYERFEVHRDVVPVLQALISRPPALKQLCRAAIVQTFGNQLYKIETLDVDDDVRRYLKYRTL